MPILPEQSTPRPFPPSIALDIERRIERWRAPGAAVIAIHGRDTYLHLRGRARISQPAAIGPDTLFDFASCGKAFTALVAAQLVEDGRLGWDQPLHEWLPELVLQDPCVTRQATVADALGNRIGIGRALPVDFGLDDRFAAADLLGRARHLAPACGFRERFAYSNVGFIAVALLVARLLDQPFADVLRERVFVPLGMSHSRIGSAALADRSRIAAPHFQGASGPVAAEPIVMDNAAGAGGVFISAHDLIIWLECCLALARGQPTGLVSPEVGRRLFEPQVVMRAHDVRPWRSTPAARIVTYAMGWAVAALPGGTACMHGGEMPGTRAHVVLLPDDGTAVAVLCNVAEPTCPAMSWAVAESLAGRGSIDWDATMTRYHEAETRALRLSAEAGMVAEEDRVPGPEDCVGRYHHPAAGIATVSIEDGRLHLRLADAPILNGVLEPADRGCFEVRHPPLIAELWAPLRPQICFARGAGAAAGLVDPRFGRFERLE